MTDFVNTLRLQNNEIDDWPVGVVLCAPDYKDKVSIPGQIICMISSGICSVSMC